MWDPKVTVPLRHGLLDNNVWVCMVTPIACEIHIAFLHVVVTACARLCALVTESAKELLARAAL
jgi:hypothetical protein